MSTAVDIRALARLARLQVTDAEVEKLEKELPHIVAFVDTLQKVAAELPEVPRHEHRNILREDIVTREVGEYTDRILDAVPEVRDGYVVVKKVLSK